MAPRLAFAIPGSLDARTGGTIYDRLLLAALRRAGWRVEHLEWPAGFPFPDVRTRAAATASLAGLADEALVLIDGLAYGVLPDLAAGEGRRLRLVALVHHPLALESGLPAGVAAGLAASERRALAAARAVIVTSGTTAAILATDFAVPMKRITVAAPGVDPPTRRRARRSEGPIRLFSLGSLTPRKAHNRLVEALGGLKALDWICVIAGETDRSPETAAALRRQIAELGLGERITLAGEIPDVPVQEHYANADIFVLASLYEGYGMVFAEALTYGLPIVATRGGAAPEVVGPEAGELVEPDDPDALREALRRLIEDTNRRESLAAGALRAARRLQTWDDTAAKVASRLLALEGAGKDAVE